MEKRNHALRTGMIAVILLIVAAIVYLLFVLSWGRAHLQSAAVAERQTVMCGDGTIDDDTEECDDGNLQMQDGCSLCRVDPRHACIGAPSVCAAIGAPRQVETVPTEVLCGNGIIDGETCDDGNVTDGDGCTSTCSVEQGYACGGQPSACETIRATGEPQVRATTTQSTARAEDTPRAAATSASSSEEGMTNDPALPAAVLPGATRPSLRQLREEGLRNRDTTPFVWQPSSLDALRCGDGLVTGKEQCDDGALQDGDGCGRGCTIEPGYRCGGEPTDCRYSCGDGMTNDAETCDDGNSASGDGCSRECLIEKSYSCSGTPSTCVGPD